MDTALIFVCHTCFFLSFPFELIDCPGCVIRGFLERFPDLVGGRWWRSNLNLDLVVDQRGLVVIPTIFRVRFNLAD